MSYGIEVRGAAGELSLGMQDFTYTKIFEATIPAAGGDTSVYPVVVPGYSDADCVVIFTPVAYINGNQEGYLVAGGGGFVPVYKSLGGETVGVVRRAQARYWDSSNQRWENYHTLTAAAKMSVYKVFGG